MHLGVDRYLTCRKELPSWVLLNTADFELVALVILLRLVERTINNSKPRSEPRNELWAVLVDVIVPDLPIRALPLEWFANYFLDCELDSGLVESIHIKLRLIDSVVWVLVHVH